jgi:hypothetical protein
MKVGEVGVKLDIEGIKASCGSEKSGRGDEDCK